MVDSIGNKATAVTDRRLASVTTTQASATTSVSETEAAGTTAAVDSQSATDLSRAMASEAPVDSDRVAEIRKAVQDGTFPIVPAQIADRLIALKLQWSPNDDAA